MKKQPRRQILRPFRGPKSPARLPSGTLFSMVGWLVGPEEGVVFLCLTALLSAVCLSVLGTRALPISAFGRFGQFLCRGRPQDPAERIFFDISYITQDWFFLRATSRQFSGWGTARGSFLYHTNPYPFFKLCLLLFLLQLAEKAGR